MRLIQDIEQATLYVSGRIDASNAREFDEALRSMGDALDGPLTVDMSEATYVSSSGLRYLLLAHRRQLAAGNCLRLRGVPPKIMHILSLAGFDRILNLAPDCSQA